MLLSMQKYTTNSQTSIYLRVCSEHQSLKPHQGELLHGIIIDLFLSPYFLPHLYALGATFTPFKSQGVLQSYKIQLEE